MHRLSYDEVLDLFTRYRAGPTARFNHYDLDPRCEGSSKSVRITEDDDGRAFYYRCYRCGDFHGRVALPVSGSSRLSQVHSGKQDGNQQAGAGCGGATGSHRKYYGRDSEYPATNLEPLQWPVAFRRWALTYLTLSEVARATLGYDAHAGRLVLPVRSGGDIVRWSARGPDGEQPKYKSGQVTGYTTHGPVGADSAAPYYGVVVTEDVLSAWVVTLEGGGKWYGWPALCANPPPTQLAELATTTRRVIVWLDNDNAQVKRASRKITKDLEGLGVWSTRRVSNYDEPKRQPRHVVRSVLND